MKRIGRATPLLGGVLVLAAAVTPSCADCTDAGCGNLVTFHVTAGLQAGQPYQIEACVDGACQSGTLQVSETGGAIGQVVDGLVLDPKSDTIYLSFAEAADWEGTHPVTLTVRDDSGAILVDHAGNLTFGRDQPNGPNCPPTCWVGEVSV